MDSRLRGNDTEVTRTAGASSLLRRGSMPFIFSARWIYERYAAMIIGTLRLEFRLHGVFSLKEKRKSANSLKQKLRNTFNVAVAETESQDSHQVLVLGVVTVSNDTAHVHSRLSKVLAMVEASTADELVHADMDVFGA
ncbi:Uncharacterized conserved protein YlxP, DUF503 family [Desulfomicrobium norvegicum]|uniref:Uncharacterized conserved protein YlxP, DUF503 family n=2 Tax=Desulfomicrobium TaxID=898 RepID=A0A8G2F377_DESNO|nr:Uncharacterized conserved protein YlxP, DUF503 family [Desulfomicrobium norvegicum]